MCTNSNPRQAFTINSISMYRIQCPHKISTLPTTHMYPSATQQSRTIAKGPCSSVPAVQCQRQSLVYLTIPLRKHYHHYHFEFLGNGNGWRVVISAASPLCMSVASDPYISTRTRIPPRSCHLSARRLLHTVSLEQLSHPEGGG